MSSVDDRAFGGAGRHGAHRPAKMVGPQKKPSLAYYIVLFGVLALFSFAMIAGEPQSDQDRNHYLREWSDNNLTKKPSIYDGRGKWGGYAD